MGDNRRFQSYDWFAEAKGVLDLRLNDELFFGESEFAGLISLYHQIYFADIF